jgi:hypothetical protein
MGQVTIEIPQNVNRLYRIDDSEFGERLLNDLEDFEEKTKAEKTQAIIPPRRHSLKEDLAQAVGVWANREESADETARRIRDKNNGKR